jgi:FkbM family methyltransferase
LRYVRLLLLYSNHPVKSIFISLLLISNGNILFSFKGSNFTIKINAPQLYPLLSLLDKGWQIKEISAEYVTLQKDVCLKCRLLKGSDLGHINEIYEEKAYGIEPREYVVDAGASNGDSAIYFAVNGASKVLALEPDPESYALAEENIKKNKLEANVILLQAALSSTEGEANFLIPVSSPNTSHLKPAEGLSKAMDFGHSKQIQAKTVTLQTLIQKYSLPRVDLLKLDCEGCEYDVLTSLDPETLMKIRAIFLEYHDGHRNLPKLLSDNGFSIKAENSKHQGYIRARRNAT